MPPDIPSFNASKLRFGEGGEANLLLTLHWVHTRRNRAWASVRGNQQGGTPQRPRGPTHSNELILAFRACSGFSFPGPLFLYLLWLVLVRVKCNCMSTDLNMKSFFYFLPKSGSGRSYKICLSPRTVGFYKGAYRWL